ncbi:PadR family transcriptional regulator [Psychrobacillus glaciei]|uniref:PadR family transcriptional regulator n=1 Tax=Psychrobacillus glaciei TaxID=2283160 RepID=A0A5J6SN67_9BACI|nr:PadR family transcriptional regulator [Psychrobacillus glaciei]QFF99376.1 PadR family transcriptional regulator [Psychrobacillus glaciei]
MDERLKCLKKSMDKTSFSKLNFTERHRKAIQERMFNAENEEAIFLAALQLLVQEKTGYELVKLLRGRGMRKFEENEGIVYTLLHQLEQDGYLQSSWNDSNVKYYRLNNKGTKLLRKSEKQSTTKTFSFKKLVEE